MQLYACEIQAQIDGAEAKAFSPAAALRAARSLARPSGVEELAAFYRSLELLTPDWRTLLESPGAAPVESPELRAFAGYELNRYWLHAVSDLELAARVKMVLGAVILLAHLGGDGQPARLRAMTLYSKEIDDDPDNLDALLDAAYRTAAFTDDRLLGLLLLGQWRYSQ